MEIPQKPVAAAIDWIAKQAIRFPDKLAQVDLGSGREYDYRQMNERVGRVASHLQSIGVRRGDRIGYLMANSSDVFEIIFGCWRVGAVALALNWRLTASELEYIINDAEPCAIIVDNDLSELSDELKSTTKVRHWIGTDGQGGVSEYEAALTAAGPVLDKVLEQPLSDMCMLMYSSGTTGKPKGVIITHEMMFYFAVSTGTDVRLTQESVSLTVMPLFHIGGVNCPACPTFYLGGTVLVARAFDPGDTLGYIGDAKLGVTHFLGVPAMYNALKVHADNAKTDFSRVVTPFVGAEAVPEPLLNWWIERGLKLSEGYGMTESAAGALFLPAAYVGKKTGSAGKVSMHMELRVVLENGDDAPNGQSGELWMKGPMLTPGYWNRPDANKESFVDGWFRTGDIVIRDSDNFYSIEDLVKDMYISGGENVYPAEVESILYEMDQIAEVAVIGVPDSKWGESGCAVVALTGGAALTIEDVHVHVADRLAKFKQPAHLAIVDALPRTASGKVQKFELRQSIPGQLLLN